MNKDVIDERATKRLLALSRCTMPFKSDKTEMVLLCPELVDLCVLKDGTVSTAGLGKIDVKKSDLIQLIRISDPLEIDFEWRPVIGPRTYIESLTDIPHHISVQAILFARGEWCGRMISEMQKEFSYGRTEYDAVWINKRPPGEVMQSDLLFIMNRRVGGWDGRRERPVVELFGAGGHVPVMFDQDSDSWTSYTLEKTIMKEAKEEIGVDINKDRIRPLGGFKNDMAGELVAIVGIEVYAHEIQTLQKRAYKNYEHNTDGLYFGGFLETIDQYKKNASMFAGGEAVKLTNFPCNQKVLDRIIGRIGI